MGSHLSKCCNFGKGCFKRDNAASSTPFSTLTNEDRISDRDNSNLVDYNDWLREELLKHTKCGEECQLLCSLEKIDATVTVDTNSDVNTQILTDSQKFVEAISEALKDIDPIWACSTEQRGSTTNGMKTGQLDEVDFLLKLDNIRLDVKDNSQLICDEKGLIRIPDRVLDNYGSNRQIVSYLDPEESVESSLKRFITSHKFVDANGWYLSARAVKHQFIEALKNALQTVSQAGNTLTGHSMTHFIFDGRRNMLFFFPLDIPHAVKLDLTPCVSYTYNNENQQWLIPKARLNNWAMVNEDPVETEVLIVRQAVRVIKTLRDIEEEFIGVVIDENPCCVVKEREEDVVVLEHLSMYVTRQLGRKILPNFYSIPSYAILGTVVQCYKKYAEQSLCFLVLNSLLHLKLVDPAGKPFCRQRMPAPHSDFRRILNDVLTHDVSNFSFVSQFLPASYNTRQLPLEHIVKDFGSLKFSVSIHLNDVPCDVVWEVFRLDKHKFTSSLLRQMPWITMTQLPELHAELVEGDGKGKLYLSVLKFKDAYCYSLRNALVVQIDSLSRMLRSGVEINQPVLKSELADVFDSSFARSILPLRRAVI